MNELSQSFFFPISKTRRDCGKTLEDRPGLKLRRRTIGMLLKCLTLIEENKKDLTHYFAGIVRESGGER
jgi:hypothetical protein